MQPAPKYKSSLKSKIDYFNNYVEATDYNSLEEIVKAFPHLASLNKLSANPGPCHGLVIRSGNDDNIHKAIKYGIWTTTYKNKHKLEDYWRQYVNNKTETYLFFSAVKSGHFEGVARLASGYNEETFPFWWENQNGKFKGHFDIEWVYVKDITYRHFYGLKNLDNEDITKSKDCDEISEEVTKKMLGIFHEYKKNKSIFSSFSFFDDREKNELRASFMTLEQQMWYMEHLKQMQLQQYYYSNMGMVPPAVGNMYYDPQQQPLLLGGGLPGVGGVKDAGLKPAVIGSSNPGFQMNPVSKNKKPANSKN